jgi:hypothetical protein
MLSNKSIIFLALVIIGIVAIVLVLGINKQGSAPEGELKVSVVTDKEEYEKGKDVLKVKIENTSEEKICFSSCPSFYLQKKDGGYDGFDYEECSGESIVEKCIDPLEVKAFAIEVPSGIGGRYLLAIPACIGCSIQQKFEEDQKIYSNEFIIK